MDKSYNTIFAEFEENYIPVSFEGSGDVKYHKGFFSTSETIHGKKVNIISVAKSKSSRIGRSGG